MNELNFDKMIVELCRAEMETRKQLVECLRQVNNRKLFLIRGRKTFTEYCQLDLQYGPKEIRELFIALGMIVPKEKMVSEDPLVQQRIDGLRAWRLQKSLIHNLPAFHFINNKTVMALANKNPDTMEQLRLIYGLGPKKTEKWGSEILSVLKSDVSMSKKQNGELQSSFLN